MLTTLYGSLFADPFLRPLAQRMERLHDAELTQLVFDAEAILDLHTAPTARSGRATGSPGPRTWRPPAPR